MPRHQHSELSHTQNFLHSPRLVERIVELAGIGRDDLVIEIGPGEGIITDALTRRSGRVLAIEKDPRYVELLTRQYAESPRVAVFAADALDFPMPATPYKVFASIPYDITTAIVSKLTSGIAPPAAAFLIMQREAAERISGQPTETLVSLSAKPWYETRIMYRFRRSDFRPAPAVDSVLIRIERRVEPIIPTELGDCYRELLAAIFSAWKPTVEAALREFLTPEMVDQTRRRFGGALRSKPSLLAFEHWIELVTLLTEIGDDRLWNTFAEAQARLHKQQAGLRKQHRSRTSDRTGRAPVRGQPDWSTPRSGDEHSPRDGTANPPNFPRTPANTRGR